MWTGTSKWQRRRDEYLPQRSILSQIHQAQSIPTLEQQPGAYIRSLEGGELWGRVVCDQGRSWQLASGRSAKKEMLGGMLFAMFHVVETMVNMANFPLTIVVKNG